MRFGYVMEQAEATLINTKLLLRWHDVAAKRQSSILKPKDTGQFKI